METIERLDRDVQSAMQAVRALGDRSAGTLNEVEHDLWLALLAVGRAVIALYLAKRAARPRVAQYTHDLRRSREMTRACSRKVTQPARRGPAVLSREASKGGALMR